MENASGGYFNKQTNSIVYFKNLEGKGTTASLPIHDGSFMNLIHDGSFGKHKTVILDVIHPLPCDQASIFNSTSKPQCLVLIDIPVILS